MKKILVAIKKGRCIGELLEQEKNIVQYDSFMRIEEVPRNCWRRKLLLQSFHDTPRSIPAKSCCSCGFFSVSI
jgi:hypothetical protein